MILTIDIGIKNLSFCIMSNDENKQVSNYCIHLWDIYNIIPDEEIHYCTTIQKNSKVCNKKATYFFETQGEPSQFIYCCKTHNKNTKSKLIKKPKKISTYLLQDLTILIHKKLNEIYSSNKDIFDKLTHIFIELQPKINQRMKFVSHIIYGKLTDLQNESSNTKIRFISASKKLKLPYEYTQELITLFNSCTLRDPYKKRKWKSIMYTDWLFKNHINENQKELWYDFFNKQTKKDDLSDVFLYCIYLFHNNKINS